ncbi:MAG: heparinase II/III family protein [Planctomycetota bacterium]|jgi:hypothetical protein|nr:heparinase II/III family protein [Planctomycetota bacterium]
MPLFLTDTERELILQSKDSTIKGYLWALYRRAAKHAEEPGLVDRDTTTEWWFVAMEYLTDAAMAYALKRDDTIGTWIRATVLELARRSDDDWVGPWFRNHGGEHKTGHLETAHLSWACTIGLDLAADVFTAAEQDEIRTVLRERAIPMCLRWIDNTKHLANWRCVLLAGATMPAALLNDTAVLERCTMEWQRTVECFQQDGTYGESLQYSHYAMYSMMLAYEALYRRDPKLTENLSVERYGRGMRWHAASLLYRKPLGGEWGEHPRPRAANFNDCGTHFAPSPELLCHIAVRCKDSLPTEAGLARWICDNYWSPMPDIGPHDRASFGLLTDWGGLTLPLLVQAPPAISPSEAGLERVVAVDNGDVLVRDKWDGDTVLAIRGGGEELYGHGHLHGDLNSFILAHRKERLLADPGHSCYRNVLHQIECQSSQHNTCTFTAEVQSELQEDVGKTRHMEQTTSVPKRVYIDGKPGPTIDRGAYRLIAAHDAELAVVGSEAAKCYGQPIERFARFWFMAGSNALFVVDHIVASTPVRTTWNWVLNNRADALDLKVFDDRAVARRGAAGMKLFNCSGAHRNFIRHGWLHEAYHVFPGQLGEGKNGSATILPFFETEAATERWAVHAFAIDDGGAIAGWHLRDEDGAAAVLEAPGGTERWSLRIDEQAGTIDLVGLERSWRLSTQGECKLKQLS